MTGLGMIVLYLGYAVIYWAIQSFQGNSQDSFISYLIPGAPTNSGGSSQSTSPAGTPPGVKGPVGANGQTIPVPNTPADQKSAVKIPPGVTGPMTG